MRRAAVGFRDKHSADVNRIDALEDELAEKDAELERLRSEKDAELERLRAELTPKSEPPKPREKPQKAKRSAGLRILVNGLVFGVALLVVGAVLLLKYSATLFACKAGKECGCDSTSACTKKCSGMGCEMKCPLGASCHFACDAGGCSVIAEDSTVDLSCKGGGCELKCVHATCDFSCEGGNCVLRTDNFGEAASISCPGGGCRVECGGSGECKLTHCKSGCTCEEKHRGARCLDASPVCEPDKPCVCQGADACTKRCSGKGCKMECRARGGGQDCNFACEQGGCAVISDDHDAKLSCPGGGCTMDCGYHGRCEITDCKGGGCKCRSKDFTGGLLPLNPTVCEGIGAEVVTAVPDCACAAGDGWKEPKIEWTLAQRTYSGEPEMSGGWQGTLAIHPPGNSATTTRKWFDLVKGDAIPGSALPDKPGMPFRAGVACATHFMAIVGGVHLNRFDTDTHGKVHQWYAKLKAPVKPPPDSRDGACFALPTDDGIAAIPLEDGSEVWLHLETGQLR